VINVLIISSYRLICASLEQIIDRNPDFHVVDVAAKLEEVPRYVGGNQIDVILLEVCPPSVEHFELIKQMLKMNHELKFLVLCTQAAEPLPSQFLQAGAKGFITRQATVEEVLTAIREVDAGNRYLGIECAQQMALGKMSGENPFSSLSAREMQVMMMITSGRKVMSISDQLCLSPKTINTYRYRLFSKLGVDSDVTLTRLAIRQGLMEA